MRRERSQGGVAVEAGAGAKELPKPTQKVHHQRAPRTREKQRKETVRIWRWMNGKVRNGSGKMSMFGRMSMVMCGWVRRKQSQRRNPKRRSHAEPPALTQQLRQPQRNPRRRDPDPKRTMRRVRQPLVKRSNAKRTIPKQAPEHGLLPPAPDTEKEIKKEIYDFLLETRTLTQLNAKEHLRKLVPEYKVLGYTAKLNIYWVRRKVQGVGVGITSITEGQDVGFIGFKPLSPNWITAIAAAIKAGDIFAAFLHTDCGVAVLTLYPLRARSWFPGLKDGLKKNKYKCMHGHYIVTKYK